MTGYKDDGKPIRKTKRADTKKEVLQWMDKLKHQVLTSGYIRASDTSQFEILYKRWFHQHYSHAWDTYRQGLIERSNKIIVYFGEMEVGKITKEIATGFFTEELRRCTRETVKKLQNLLDNFFDYCQENDYIIKHPTKSIVLKGGNYLKKQTKKRESLTGEEIQRVEKVLENAPIRDKALLTFLLHTGVRPGEVRAVKWTDFQDRILTISKAVKKKVEYEDDGWTEKKKYEAVGNPKGSRDGMVRTREIPIGNELQIVLDEWQEHQEQSRLPNPHNLVFPKIDERRDRAGDFYTYGGLKSLWKRTLKKYGLKDLGRCLYATRHTFATKLHENNVPLSHISSAMGHRKISTTTDIYIDKPDVGALKTTIRDWLNRVYGTKVS